MSFKDIGEARANRAAKEAIKGKAKRGRKRKMTTPEPGEPEPEVALMIQAQVAEDQITTRERETVVMFCTSNGLLGAARAGFATSSCTLELVFVVFFTQG